MVKEMLETRRKIKAKKPSFKRPDSWKFAKLSEGWNKPKGRDHKVRRRMRGALPHPSYGSPKAVRGLHPSGLRDILVRKVSDLDGLDPKADAARIGGTVGVKKRLEIVEAAKKLGLRVLNVGDATKKAIRALKKPKAKKKESKTAEKPKAEKKETKPKAEKKAEPKKEVAKKAKE